ncbi:hypothetical protein KW785_00715 [Candidatus Parcubacteria bacterium]|nr:hypothetical protein [Candidatus Parcubacteria bacterium]
MDQNTKKYLDEQFAKMASKDDLVVLRSEMATKNDLADVHNQIVEVHSTMQALATHIDQRFDEIMPAIERIEDYDRRLAYLEDRLPRTA